MKGSTGWFLLGMVAIILLFFMVRSFAQNALSYKLKHQEIIFGELDIMRVKNTVMLAEKSLPVSWKFSALQQIFDAGQNGFGSPYWHKASPGDGSQAGRVPGDSDIKMYMENSLRSYKGFGGVETINDIGLAMSTIPRITLGDSSIAADISGSVKAFAGDARNPTTESKKGIVSSFSYSIRFRNLVSSAKTFAESLSRMSAPAYSALAATYINNAVDMLKSFSASPASGIKPGDFTVNKKELLVPASTEAGVLAPLSGLIFHYDVAATFVEDTKPENQYMYYDEPNRQFVKKPFSLTVKAEDYLVALDCAKNNGRLFTYASSNDMTCDSGKIYACNTDITGIGGNKLAQCAGKAGGYGCGNEGFKEIGALENSPCYCTAFGGSWIEKKWVCTETLESAAPVDGWACKLAQTRYDCKPTATNCPAQPPKAVDSYECKVQACPIGAAEPVKGCDCTRKDTYTCTRDKPTESCTRCSISGKACEVPRDCRSVG